MEGVQKKGVGGSIKLQVAPCRVAVDEDGKATEFKVFALSSPHMRAFHLAWLSLFSCYFSTFSIPPLLPAIRSDLQLTPKDTGSAAAAAFAGAILSRFLMGPACDLVGPRIALATLSLLTAPAILATSQITSSTSFIIVRFIVGFSLANFVANQYWMSSMFSSQVVGLANGLAAGWANVGAGVTQVVMPIVFSSLITTLNIPQSTAWRLSFIFPAMFQTLTAIMVLLFGTDQPESKYRGPKPNTQLPKEDRSSSSFIWVLLNGLKNYRGWVLGLAYGYAFGVELTVDNMIAEYFYDRFGVNIQMAGMIAASFGVANCVSRPIGGIMSDRLGKRFGMRGRLWGLWTVQTTAGLLCILLGRVPSLWGSFAVMCFFSFFCQAASGLIFGVVPFVSKRSRGVITGMAGSGGTVGAVVTQLLLFSGQEFSKQTSISLMGLMTVVCCLPVATIYFPQWGGMFCGGAAADSNLEEEEEEDKDDDYRMISA